MRRRTFDVLATTAGLLIAGLLLVAGGLLTWGHNFVTSEVHTQLAAQKIVFPPANSPAVAGPQFAPMRQYGGQLMTTGAQAQVYADHFIAVHLTEIGGGQTYAQLSAKALAQPKNAALAAQVQTMFRGQTLRGLLLNAYAFGTIGQIMLYAAIAAFAGAGLLLLLAIFGFVHLRRTAPDAEIFPDRHPRAGQLLLTARTGLPGQGPPPPGPPGGGRCFRPVSRPAARRGTPQPARWPRRPPPEGSPPFLGPRSRGTRPVGS